MTNNKSGSVSRETSACDIRHRRAMLKMAVLGGGATVAGLFRNPVLHAAPTPKEETAQAAVDKATRGMPAPRIKDVSVIDVGGKGMDPITTVKVTTDQAGLYGYGDATWTTPGGKALLVKAMVEQYLKPLVMGRTTDRIEQIWQLCYMSSYYKNDNVQNVAIAGLTDALWDIKGRQAGMPVYQLVGGKCRDAAHFYMALGFDAKDPARTVVENAKKSLASGNGIRFLRLTWGNSAGTANTLYGTPTFDDGAVPFDRDKAIRNTLTALEAFRKEMPPEIGLIVDCHSEFDGPQAMQFSKDLEQFKLFYLEDVLAPEAIDHYRVIRKVCSTPQAVGELFSNRHEWQPLIEERLIDYIRCHVAHIGGFTAARKLAALADNYEVKFAWHGHPASPVEHMTNLTLDLTNENFGIHEHFGYTPTTQAIFQGSIEAKDSYVWINEKPGWGIEIDEALAAKNPRTGDEPHGTVRAPDGSVTPGI